jgi:hypothetical protein
MTSHVNSLRLWSPKTDQHETVPRAFCHVQRAARYCFVEIRTVYIEKNTITLFKIN